MDRKQVALIAACLAVAGLNSRAEEPRPPADPLAKATAVAKAEGETANDGNAKPNRPDRDQPGKDADRDKPQRRTPGGPEAEKAREAFKNLSPEERERWIKRFREWSEMSPERKKALQDREESFRRRVREDIDKAVEQSGLTLNDEQKKQFAQRYMEERRKIEEDLRKQMEEIRRPKVQAMVEKLKDEFSSAAKTEPKAEAGK